MLINKKFILSNSSVNAYGFRLMTDGCMLSEFAKNPLGLYMHRREDGVIVRWTNLKIEGDEITAFPDINISNPRGQRTVDEVESGFLNAASVGSIVIVESDKDPSLIGDGQTLVTVTKWYFKECSLVDIPANPDALVLYDKNESAIQLKRNPKTARPQMPSKPNLLHSPSTSISLSHKEDATDNAIIDVDELLKSAVKDKDINQETAKELKKSYGHNPKKLKELLDEFAKHRLNYLMGLEWDELDKNDLLEELKEKSFAGFKQKFFDAFHKEYIGKASGKSAFNSDNIDVDALLTHHIKNNGLAPDTAAMMKQNFKDNPQKLKETLEKQAKQRIEDLAGMDWDELDQNGLLEELKEKNLPAFKKKFKEKFGVDCKTVNQ